jgi:hypothetical protein
MAILTKRNAVIGWFALMVGRTYARRKMHRIGGRRRFAR